MNDCCGATSNPSRSAVIHLYKDTKYTFKLISIALIYDRRAHRKRRRHKEKKESADKPGSVVDSHSSRPCVAARLKQPTRERRGPRHAPLFGLAPGGVCHATRRCPRARCALTAPFHPYLIHPLQRPCGFVADGHRRSVLCCTFRRLTPPRRYLAPCPAEPGLSSKRLRISRLSGRLRRHSTANGPSALRRVKKFSRRASNTARCAVRR